MKRENTQKTDRAVSPAALPVSRPPSLKNPADLLSTVEAAHLMQYEPATLRNYVWLLSLSRRERLQRGLQDPPAGLPKPRRNRGRLYFSAAAVAEFTKKKNNTAAP